MPRSVDTYMTVDSNGNISFDFTGHISAQGIDMIASPDDVSPSAQSQIIWHLATIAGASLVRVLGYRLASALPQPRNALGIIASNPAGTNKSSLVVDVTDVASPGANPSSITFSVDNGAKNTLYDGAQQSAFLQLTGVAKRKISWGRAAFNWGGTNFASVVVAHNLGASPANIQVTCNGSNTLATCRILTWDATNFTVQFYANVNGGVAPGAGTADGFDWEVIG